MIYCVSDKRNLVLGRRREAKLSRDGTPEAVTGRDGDMERHHPALKFFVLAHAPTAHPNYLVGYGELQTKNSNKINNRVT